MGDETEQSCFCVGIQLKNFFTVPIIIATIVIAPIMIVPFFSPYPDQATNEYTCDRFGCPDYNKLAASCENSVIRQAELGPTDSPTGIYTVISITKANKFCNIVTTEQSRNENGTLQTNAIVSACNIPIENTFWPRVLGIKLDMSQYCK